MTSEIDRLRAAIVTRDENGRPVTIGEVADDPVFCGELRGLCEQLIESPAMDARGLLRARWILAVLAVVTEHKRGRKN